MTVSPEDPAALRSKKQRTAADDQPLATLDVNALPFYHQNPSFFDQRFFSLPMPTQENGINYRAHTHEIPQGQVINVQAASPPAFNSPSELTATVEMDQTENSFDSEQFSSSPTNSSQDLNALFEFNLMNPRYPLIRRTHLFRNCFHLHPCMRAGTVPIREKTVVVDLNPVAL